MPVYLDVQNRAESLIKPIILSLMLLGLVGCADTDEQILLLQKQNQKLERQLDQAQQDIAERQSTIAGKDRQIASLSELGPDRREVLKVVFKVEKIALGRYTGGANLDDKIGDDGVRVYVIPKDQAGRTVTAAGSVEIDVFDLAQKDKPLLMSYSFSPVQAKEHWRSGALANHYNFACPWKNALPTGDQITISVKFVDYLTGQTFTATKQCPIRIISD